MNQRTNRVEQRLSEFFANVRTQERVPDGLWSSVAARIHSEGSVLRHETVLPVSGFRQTRWPFVGVRSLGIALLLVLLAFGSAGAFLLLNRQAAPVSAESVLMRAQVAEISPSSAGIVSIHATQTYTQYFLGAERRQLPALIIESEAWYDAPDLQRIEQNLRTLDLAGQVTQQSSHKEVWTGDEYWRVDGETAYRYQQTRSVDVYAQAALRGLIPWGELGEWLACRTPRLDGEEVVAARVTYRIWLSRATCGMPTPGVDGPMMLFVDKETGLVLKVVQLSADGLPYYTQEIRAIEIDSVIGPERFAFTPSPGTAVEDRRTEPSGGEVYALEMTQTTLERVAASVSFEVLTPGFLPDGFHLESVEEYRPSHPQASESVSFIVLRYADSEGNWLAIGEGVSGNTVAEVGGAPEEFTGIVEVNGKPARWIQGWPSGSVWESGTRTSLSWEYSRNGDNYEVDPSGRRAWGSGIMVGMSSNALSVDQLADIARALN